MDNSTVTSDAPPPGYKYMECRHCHRGVLVRTIRKRPALHPECAVEIQSESIRQIRDKSGPMYQRWLMGNLLAAQRGLRGGTSDKG